MQFSPILPTQPFQPNSPIPNVPIDISTFDQAIVYLKITIDSSDIYDPDCLIIGEGDSQLRWAFGEDRLRWLGSDSDLRWTADYRLGTGQC